MWRSATQQIITLSSSEAKWVALSNTDKKVMPVSQLLTNIISQVHFPNTVNVDDMGAIFISWNGTMTSRTRHNVKYKYVNENIINGMVKIIFMKSKDNYVDAFMENFSRGLNQIQSSRFVSMKKFGTYCCNE